MSRDDDWTTENFSWTMELQANSFSLNQVLTGIGAGTAISVASGPWIDRYFGPAPILAAVPGELPGVCSSLSVFGHDTSALVVPLLAGCMEAGFRFRLLRLVMAPAVVGLVAAFARALVARPRLMFSGTLESTVRNLAIALLDNGHQSFPSGHAATAVALALSLSANYPGGHPVIYNLAIATAFERVAAEPNFPSPVVADAAIGIPACSIANQVFSPRNGTLLSDGNSHEPRGFNQQGI